MTEPFGNPVPLDNNYSFDSRNIFASHSSWENGENIIDYSDLE